MTGRRQRTEPLLMGAAEAARALGVRQTNLRIVRGLPEPYGKVSATTLWRSTDIRRLAREMSKGKVESGPVEKVESESTGP